jgi:hypothetical protein
MEVGVAYSQEACSCCDVLLKLAVVPLLETTTAEDVLWNGRGKRRSPAQKHSKAKLTML